jgi:hypothetical protein
LMAATRRSTPCTPAVTPPWLLAASPSRTLQVRQLRRSLTCALTASTRACT